MQRLCVRCFFVAGYGQAGARPQSYGQPQYGNSYGAAPGQYDGKPSYTQQNGGYTPQQGSATAGKPGMEDLKAGSATGTLTAVMCQMVTVT